MATNRLYPIGMQFFPEIIQRGMAYVDKTQFIYQMVYEGKYYFLARPRRFGKTLLISTMEAYFKGQKELFSGLAIEKLERDWIQYPVLRFDMSRAKKESVQQLKDILDALLNENEKVYGRNSKTKDDNYSLRMSELIAAAKAKTGQNVVILIDEYDSPLLHVMHDKPLMQEMRTILRDFYQPLKFMDADLKFVFLTGITKFSQLSIFSELNNLTIISMFDEYAPICGISKEELLTQFKDDIIDIGEKNNWSEEETNARLKQKYDGYHFSKNSPDIFNPFSLLNALRFKELEHFWFSSGTPTFLAEQIAKYASGGIDPEQYDKGFWTYQERFNVPVELAIDVLPTLYQSGYLTIKEYDSERNAYCLAYPNEEVRLGFIRCLIPYYMHENPGDNEAYIFSLLDLFREHDIDGVLKLTRAFLSDIPYDATRLDEKFYRTIVYLICRLLMPYMIRAEHKNAAGRSDVIIETKDAVFCFEFKMGGKPETALKQIDDKGYLLSYSAGSKQLYKVGAVFDQKKRTLGRWKIVS